ncbi:unannotated protein [freshwater metagenome]|uniref:Unannotated protein n=1 Tax=freshwater metagenome TaxID=449393 RepID=A0A6J7FJG8_9ZZZZ|nr:hypothetical protein [Actinomycetota bacterium]
MSQRAPEAEVELVPIVIPTDDESDGRIGALPIDQMAIVGRRRGWLLVRDLRDRSLYLTAGQTRFAAWRRRRTDTPTATEVAALREQLEHVPGEAPR